MVLWKEYFLFNLDNKENLCNLIIVKLFTQWIMWTLISSLYLKGVLYVKWSDGVHTKFADH